MNLEIYNKLSPKTFDYGKNVIEKTIFKNPIDINKNITKPSCELLQAYTEKAFEKLFPSIEDARKYAQNRIIESLNINNPYEKVIAIDSKNNSGRVLFEIDGNGSNGRKQR